ncbi:MAG: cytochrome c oxidase accessory protein CcoG [Epsilonproteobacteria bacterium]|nr:cytochrome c oxidase accessory protein CcoG [Campylobacterota bacterium]
MKEYLKGWVPYRFQRYYTFIAVTLFALIIPWIKINGAHFFLLNFDHKQIHLFFTKFDMQELYMMPFLLIFGFLGVFFLTTLAGRIWCGWLCPQTIFRIIYRDLIETKLLGIRRSIQNKQKEPKGQYFKKAVAMLIWTVLAFVAAANFVWFFVPPEEFFQYLQNPGDHGVMMGTIFVLALFLIYDVIKLKEDFCIYVCPYARVQSVMYDEETIQTIYNTHRGGHIYADDQQTKLVNTQKELLSVDESNECTYCDACVRVCPTHIDIKAGTQLECINCLECADACTEVMGALGKESLITWTSYSAVEEERKPKFIRFRTIAYGVALTIALVGLFWMGSTKEYMLLNINRTTQLYKVKDDGQRVVNAYTFLFQNTENKDHKYFFEVVGRDDIKIERPDKAFTLRAGAKSKKVVVLSTTKELAKDNKKDTPIPITIKAYAVDDKEKVVVQRNTTFVYPRYDVLLEHRK